MDLSLVNVDWVSIMLMKNIRVLIDGAVKVVIGSMA